MLLIKRKDDCIMEYDKNICPVVNVDGVIERGKQYDLDITLPEDNRNVIYGIVRDCYKEPISDAVVKLIEVECKMGKDIRKPVSHAFTDENGEFVTEDAEYLLSGNTFVLTTKVELPVLLEGKESILPAGSHIILDATDNETYVKFTIQETGQNGMMMVERNEGDYYQITISGMNENDCFEILPYAG